MASATFDCVLEPTAVSALSISGSCDCSGRSGTEKHAYPSWLVLSVISIAVGVWLDWNRYINIFFFEAGNYALPAYCRPSIVLLAMLIFNLALSVTSKVPKIIQFMADQSLALYCLHFFFIEPALSLTGVEYRGLAILLIVAASYCSAWVLRKFIQPDLL